MSGVVSCYSINSCTLTTVLVVFVSNFYNIDIIVSHAFMLCVCLSLSLRLRIILNAMFATAPTKSTRPENYTTACTSLSPMFNITFLNLENFDSLLILFLIQREQCDVS